MMPVYSAPAPFLHILFGCLPAAQRAKRSIAASTVQDLEEEVVVPPTPRDALASLRLGPRRQLTLVTSPSPAAGSHAQSPQALAAMFMTVVDVQLRETRGRPARAPPMLRQPTPAAAAVAAAAAAAGSPSSSPAASLRQGAAASSSSVDSLSAADARPGPAQGQGLAAALAAAAALEPQSVSGALAAAAVGAGTSGAEQQASAEEEQQGGGLASLFSWFSPAKAVTASLAPEPSGGSAPAMLQTQQANAVGAPQQAAMQRPPANPRPDTAQGFPAHGGGSSNSRAGLAVQADSRPASAGPEQQQAFMTFQFGGKQQRGGPASSAAEPPGSGGVNAAESPLLKPGPGLADALERATSAAAAAEDGHLASPAPSVPRPGEAAASAAAAAAAAAAEELAAASGAAAAAATPADPEAFLAHELGGIFDEDAVEVAACHLSLAPVGEALVLSWRQSVEAILEPSERCTYSAPAQSGPCLRPFRLCTAGDASLAAFQLAHKRADRLKPPQQLHWLVFAHPAPINESLQ
jgi:hypothetical protein